MGSLSYLDYSILTGVNFIFFFWNSSKFRFKYKIWIYFIPVASVMTVLMECNLNHHTKPSAASLCLEISLSAIVFLLTCLCILSLYLKPSYITSHSSFMDCFIVQLPLRHMTVTGRFSKLLVFWWGESSFHVLWFIMLNSTILSLSYILSASDSSDLWFNYLIFTVLKSICPVILHVLFTT